MASMPVFSDQHPDIHIEDHPILMQKNGSALRQRQTNGKLDNASSNLTVSKCHTTRDLLYGINDIPPWYTSILLGFQHYLLLFGGTVSLPLVITPAMCIGNDDVGKSEVISTAFFISGLATLFQTTLGTRLPIVQSGSFTFVPAMFAILSLPKWKCPDEPDFNNLTMSGSVNMTAAENDVLLVAWRRDLWTSRMREIQGAIAVAALVQVVLGFTGALGFLLRFIGPLSIAPTICLIGLQLTEVASDYCAKQWGIAFMTMFLIILFSQYMRNINMPFLKYNRENSWHLVWFPIFKVLPVFMSMVLVWLMCFILTVSGTFPSDPNSIGFGARTDTKLQVLSQAKWFRFPYPGQWGLPTVSAAAVLGMLAGVLGGIIESIGDYCACARLSGAQAPPVHAINRGILFEGIGVLCAGLWGSGSGVTSFSENIGAIGITKVGSRHVIQVGALIMILFGMFGKFGALFVTIPEPIIGGIFMVVFGIITAVGVSNLQFVDLNSSRNLFVFGFALFFGISIPTWISKHKEVINTGVVALDQVITVLLSTNMFVGGIVGFLLDNTISGTPEERGIYSWRTHGAEDVTSGDKSPYDFPFGMAYFRRSRWPSFLPICPTFTGECFKRRGGDMHNSCDRSTRVDIDNPAIRNSSQPHSVPTNLHAARSALTKL